MALNRDQCDATFLALALLARFLHSKNNTIGGKPGIGVPPTSSEISEVASRLFVVRGIEVYTSFLECFTAADGAARALEAKQFIEEARFEFSGFADTLPAEWIFAWFPPHLFAS